MAKRIWLSVQDEDGQRILQNIRVLRQCFEPEVVAKEQAAHQLSRPRRVKVRELDFSTECGLALGGVLWNHTEIKRIDPQ